MRRSEMRRCVIALATLAALLALMSAAWAQSLAPPPPPPSTTTSCPAPSSRLLGLGVSVSAQCDMQSFSTAGDLVNALGSSGLQPINSGYARSELASLTALLN